MKIEFGFAKTEFGTVFLAFENSNISQISFSSEKAELVERLKTKNPKAEIQQMDSAWIFAQWKKLTAGPLTSTQKKQLIAKLRSGTEFQKKVWWELLQIPKGSTVFYSDIARKIKAPSAVRAVGTAVGANPLGYLIPCHRVLPKSGGLGGFAWGVELKQKMLDSEKPKALRQS